MQNPTSKMLLTGVTFFMVGSFPLAAYAGEGTSTQITSSQATGVGSVNQSPLGGVFHNNNYSSYGGNIIGVGTGYICRGAEFELFGGTSMADNSQGFKSSGHSVAFSVRMPWENDADRACKDIAQAQLRINEEQLRQKRLETGFTIVKQCKGFLESDVQVDYSFPEFAELKSCQGVKFMTQKVTAVQP